MGCVICQSRPGCKPKPTRESELAAFNANHYEYTTAMSCRCKEEKAILNFPLYFSTLSSFSHYFSNMKEKKNTFDGGASGQADLSLHRGHQGGFGEASSENVSQTNMCQVTANKEHNVPLT